MKSKSKIEFIDVESGIVVLKDEEIEIKDISYKDIIKKLSEIHKKEIH